MIKLNRDRIISFVVGYFFALVAIGLGNLLRINQWISAAILLVLVFVGIPLLRRQIAGRRKGKREQVADVQEKQEA